MTDQTLSPFLIPSAVIAAVIAMGIILWVINAIIALLRGEFRINKEYQGFRYSARIFSNENENSLRISLKLKSKGAFQIVRENTRLKQMKKWGICREVQTGDADFDSSFYILSAFHDWVFDFFQNPENRQSVRDLFHLGFSFIVYDGQKLTAIRPATNSNSMDEMEAKALPHLAALGHRLTDWSDAHVAGLPIGFQLIQALIFLVAIAGALSGILLNEASKRYPLLDGGSFIAAVYLSSFIFWSLFTIFAIRFLKGRSTSHKEILPILLMVMIAFFIGTSGGIRYFNGALDKGGEESHIGRVIEKKHYSDEDSDRWYAYVQLQKGEFMKRISITSDEFKEILPERSKMKIVTRPGYLGLKWIRRYEIINEREASP